MLLLTIHKGRSLRTAISLVFLMGALTWVLATPHIAAAAGYGDSAHGDNSIGVNRSGTPYDIGDCTQCHDTFDDTFCGVNDYMLFSPNNPASQTDNFCFQCHKGSGSEQVGGITNYTYSTNFGGGTPTFTTIYDAFNPTIGATPSSHNLADILDLVSGNHGFTDQTNACLACHNQHLAQQNYPVTATGLGGVKTAIRRVVHNDNAPGNIWGDEDYATSGYLELTNEVVQNQGLAYQSPYYGDTSDPEWEPAYEPAGDATSDGSNLPNIITFCLDCHTYQVYSTEHQDTLVSIDWLASGDQHGLRHEDGGMGDTLAPYGNASRNYVVSCMDCHEPHGSENEWLLRTIVNGKDNISVPPTGLGKWYDFCTACHEFDPQNHGTNMYHKPEPTSPIGCPDCHYHGHVHF
jgi:cytochrome c553